MSYELDPAFRHKAELFLKTKSELIGPNYGRSGIKRALDILVSSASSPVVLPILGLAGLAIWLDDGHWPFVDVGNDKATGRHVPMWKLRSMVPQALKYEYDVTQNTSLLEFKKSNKIDPRITRTGRVLRQTFLDEIPQMINVFRGDLSAVGPRLPMESDWKIIHSRGNNDPYKGFIDLLDRGLKFGVTGFYFIMGRYKLSEEDRWGLEVLYWEKQSFAADLRIIAATLPALLITKGK